MSKEYIRFIQYLACDTYFISFLGSSQALPPLSRTMTPLKLPKFQLKKLTPVLSNKPEHYYIDLPSGKFSKFLAVSLKNAFNLLAVENEGEFKVSPMQLAGNMAKVVEIAKFAQVLEDMAILHEKVSFREILEMICSDACEGQIQTVLDWVREWENGKERKNKSCTRLMNGTYRKTT